MPAKLTIEDAKDVFSGRGFILIDTEYINSETPMRYICVCGNESKMSLKNAKKGRNCSTCGRRSVSKTKTTSIADIKKIFEGYGCTLISDSYTFGEKIKYICTCGSKADITLGQAKYYGTSCKNCRSIKIGNTKRKYNIEDIRVMFSEQGKRLLATEFKNSLTPMPYICRCGSESSINLNNFLKGKDCFNCRSGKISEKTRNPNISDEERELRRTRPEHKRFRLSVFERDNYTCQCCLVKGRKLNAHHILNFADNPNVRTDIDNGITLCKPCHIKFHKTYGYRNTNLSQLAEFIAKYNANMTQTEAV